MLDVAIIGAGIIGAAIARELARYNLSIAVFDQAEDISEGTTKANSAIVHSGYDAKQGSLKARFNIRGNQLFEAWCRELGAPFLRNTSLVLAFSDEEKTGLEKLLTRGRENGVPGLRIIGRSELREREPLVSPDAVGALLAETGGICSPYELAINLCEQAAANDVRFHLSCPVVRVKKASDCRGFELETGKGVFHAAIVINAAGVHADTINNQISAHTFSITARRGEYWMLDRAAGPAFRATVFQMPTAMGKGVLVTPTVEGTIIVGPTAADIPDKTDVRTTAAKLSEILRVARKTWPSMPDRQFITAFAGLRAHCDCDDFIVGEPPDAPGFFNVAGIESPGLTAAPAIAEAIAGQVVERLGASLRDLFRPGPVHPKPLREMDAAERQAAVAADPAYGRVICRCETVSEAEVRAAIRRAPGARTVDGVKRRTRAGMGRCQGGFCLPRVLSILHDELGVPEIELTKAGYESKILAGTLLSFHQAARLHQSSRQHQATGSPERMNTPGKGESTDWPDPEPDTQKEAGDRP